VQQNDNFSTNVVRRAVPLR